MIPAESQCTDAIFHVLTVASDREQYEAMRASFEKAGFTPDRARFELGDNTQGNLCTPYDLLRSVHESGREPYVILCHQDIRLDLGHGFNQLTDQIRHLNERHPRWSLAGNAGINRKGHLVLHINDPHGHRRSVNLPKRIIALDENFIVIRRAAYNPPSFGLGGFHHYGTDLCINAYMTRCEAYVIDFLITHFSAGNAESIEYHESGERLARTWRVHLLVGMIRTPTLKDLVVSKYPIVQKLIQTKLARKILWRLHMPFIPAKRRRPKQISL